MKISDFKHDDWVKQWAGTWSILSFSYWGKVYSKTPFSNNVRRYVDQTIMFWKGDNSYAVQRLSLKKKFGRKLNKVFGKDPKKIIKLCAGLKKATDEFLKFTKKFEGKDISLNDYLKFQKLLADYYTNHIQVKVGADYLDQKLIGKYGDKLEEARLYAEPVFAESEIFMIKLAKLHSKKTGYDFKLILSALPEEFHDYLAGKKPLPKKSILRSRHQAAVVFSQNQKLKIEAGKKAVARTEKLISQNLGSQLKGTVAYPGIVIGKVKIILDPAKGRGFKEGDILVTGMTRPDFLPLMRKAAAVVTDSGGVLCHAAITARELKIVTIIGTETATKILKDGDLVEVDAEQGIIKKL